MRGEGEMRGWWFPLPDLDAAAEAAEADPDAFDPARSRGERLEFRLDEREDDGLEEDEALPLPLALGFGLGPRLPDDEGECCSFCFFGDDLASMVATALAAVCAMLTEMGMASPTTTTWLALLPSFSSCGFR